MKRSLIFIVLLLSCIVLSAQQKLSFSVLEFEQDVFDTSAKSAEYGKKDGNGSWYAIIKVTSNNPDDDISNSQFNFGNMSSKVEKHDEALWVYVQRNAKKVSISRPGYHTISQYDLQTTIEAGVVYKMVLTSDRVQQQVVYDVKMQKVKFLITPIIQGVLIMATNQSTGKELAVGTTDASGIVYKVMDSGKYTYRALSSDDLYHPSEGIMTLTSSDETHEEKIMLKPCFADMNFSAADNAEILINNESKGFGSWSGRLAAGTYVVTTRRVNHRDSQHKIIVEEGVPQNVDLNSPIPITGVLVVNSTPYEAEVFIDGRSYGLAPLILKDVMIGQHDILMRKEGYEDYKTSVKIEEGKSTQIEEVLSNTFPSAQYKEKCSNILATVVGTIKNRNYSTVDNCFTSRGLVRFRSLVEYGKGDVVKDSTIVFSKTANGGVIAQGLLMSFSFATKAGKKQNFVEDVVFTFDANCKIDNVTFGLGQVAENEIFCRDSSWSDETREMLMEFMENYKTAYCLKDSDYIKNVFADDAIIISTKYISNNGNKIAHRSKVEKDSYLRAVGRSFKSREFNNYSFTHIIDIHKSEKFENEKIYEILLRQQYISSSYADNGFLFLLVNMTDWENPQVKVRLWALDKIDMDEIRNAGYY